MHTNNFRDKDKCQTRCRPTTRLGTGFGGTSRPRVYRPTKNAFPQNSATSNRANFLVTTLFCLAANPLCGNDFGAGNGTRQGLCGNVCA